MTATLGKIGGSMAAKPRNETKNLTDPRGQFGTFLRWWLDRQPTDAKPLHKRIGVSERTIRKWCEGANAPALQDLDRIAVAMDFENWAVLAARVIRHCRSHDLI